MTSRFENKVFHFIIAILLLKLLYVIFDAFMNGNFWDFLIAIVIIIVLFLVSAMFIGSLFGSNEYEGSGSGGGTTIGDEQFQKLMDRYEKLCDDFIEKKQYEKAAYIQ